MSLCVFLILFLDLVRFNVCFLKTRRSVSFCGICRMMMTMLLLHVWWMFNFTYFFSPSSTADSAKGKPNISNCRCSLGNLLVFVDSIFFSLVLVLQTLQTEVELVQLCGRGFSFWIVLCNACINLLWTISLHNWSLFRSIWKRKGSDTITCLQILLRFFLSANSSSPNVLRSTWTMSNLMKRSVTWNLPSWTDGNWI